jgi:hypothetical protein
MKRIIALSSIAFLSTALFANADLEKRLEALEKKNDYLMKKVSEVNEQSANDNIKFDVDFRTSVDHIQYKNIAGQEYGNDALLSNRLWLNMGYAPTDTMVFKGQLAYNKAYGASFNQRGTGFGFDTFDWVSNQTLNDDKIRVREAYWLWTPKVGDVGFTVSLGRRPSTNGYLANFREDDPKPKSPSGHVINMEFDGASAGVKLDTVLPGMLFKICLGRGLSNASAWASNAAYYAAPSGMGGMMGASDVPGNYVDNGHLDTVDMAGFIFVPYDDGQYAVQTTYYRGFNVPGLVTNTMYNPMDPSTGGMMYMDSRGDMDGGAISAKISGIGDGISDFLDETTVFASYAISKSNPTDGKTMLGSLDSETGNSIWVGATMPNMTGGKFGIEYNKGSEHWKAFTFGEDTMAASKLNARGSAYEAYWSQPLIKNVFSMQVRYTYIDYDYTGSDGFFGDGGQAMSMSDMKMAYDMMGSAMAGAQIESASDLRVYFRYRY